MIQKQVDQITEADLRALVEETIREGLRLEYKRELSFDGDGKRKLRQAVCAFANTLGGDLVIGVEVDPNDKSVPVAVRGVPVASVDEAELLLDQAARLGLEPQLDGVIVRGVPLESGAHAFILRVPQSWRRPHRVKGERHFYGRTSAGTYPLEVPEVRRAFLASEGQTERIRSFVAERLMAVKTNRLAVPLTGTARIVLHVIPLAALEPGSELLTTEALRSAELDTLTRARAWGRLTLDGYLSWWPADAIDGEGQERSAVVTLYRSGIIESIDAFSVREDLEFIPTLTVGQGLVSATTQYLQTLAANGVATPVYVFLNFVGVEGRRLALPHRMQAGDPLVAMRVHPFDRDQLAFPEIVVTDYETPVIELLRSTFDLLWNAIGIDRSPYEDWQLLGQREPSG